MDRRDFTKVMGAVAAGMLAGSKAFAGDEKKPDGKAAAKHDCKGKNECKAMGGCKTADNSCAGKNTCKGKGGCAVPVNAAHVETKDKAGKSSCKGKSGCKGR